MCAKIQSVPWRKAQSSNIVKKTYPLSKNCTNVPEFRCIIMYRLRCFFKPVYVKKFRIRYSVFWVSPRHLNFVCRRFGIFSSILIVHVNKKKRIQYSNTAKVWNQEHLGRFLYWHTKQTFKKYDTATLCVKKIPYHHYKTPKINTQNKMRPFSAAGKNCTKNLFTNFGILC